MKSNYGTMNHKCHKLGRPITAVVVVVAAAVGGIHKSVLVFHRPIICYRLY